MEDQTEHVCIICRHVKQEGIRVVSQFICEDCEAEMVHTNAEDAKYRYFIHQMRQISMQTHL
ncbi:sigma factor G inhibitor Gin [Paenibacillus pini]|uniref:sigma factor G inhibitor Gin n=1 Tax=Paenibacillus pini TaxID=669461 RepID=UPI00055FD363|nr:sigma factor G inhibitor Gin [Paenibacillus pini]